MAQQNKLDQLFRRKLEVLEVTPQANSWELLKGQIQSKKPRISYVTTYWAVAASLILLFSVGYLVYTSSSNPQLKLVSALDHPSGGHPFQFQAPDITEQNQVKDKAPISSDEEKITTPKSKSDFNKTEFYTDEKLQLLVLEKSSFNQLDIEIPTEFPSQLMNQKNASKKSKSIGIKITYIASSQTLSEPDLQMPAKLSKVISAARHVSPAEMLADIRDAKDNLFKRN